MLAGRRTPDYVTEVTGLVVTGGGQKLQTTKDTKSHQGKPMIFFPPAAFGGSPRCDFVSLAVY